MRGIIARKYRLVAALWLLAVGLGGCTHKYETSSPTALYASFMKGEATLDCQVSCSGAWGANRQRAKAEFDRHDWYSLAMRVLTIGEGDDLTWFYLAKSAKELGFIEASNNYAQRSLAATKCDSVFNNCDGFSFPKDVQALIESLRREKRLNAGYSPISPS
jgi:hypothetical protein